jgi:hypothetical protein
VSKNVTEGSIAPRAHHKFGVHGCHLSRRFFRNCGSHPIDGLGHGDSVDANAENANAIHARPIVDSLD